MSDRWRDRKIKDSKKCRRIREEYQYYIQPDESDKDMVLMADAVKGLEARCKELEKHKEEIMQHAYDCCDFEMTLELEYRLKDF